MQIKPVPKADREHELIATLADLWEASVRPTHLFLDEDDILGMKPLVAKGLNAIPELTVAFDDDGLPLGFMGVEGDTIEMLFVSPDVFGKGVGRHLLNYGVRRLGARRLDVNEGNPGARKFYEHMGFEVTGRSELDSAGRPFPILHMKLT